MRKRLKTLLVLMLALLLVGVASGCGKAKPKDLAPVEPVVTAPEFPQGSPMDRIQKAGKVTVGVRYNLPAFGFKNSTTGQVEGFDIEIAKLVAQGIFGGTKNEAAQKITFVEAVSSNREPFLENGTVDLVAAAYAITPARKAIVDFAGPYYLLRGDIMVKADDTTVQSVSDLNGKKVCTVKGSSYVDSLRTKAPLAEVTPFDNYSLCKDALIRGEFAAEVSDQVILSGLVQTSDEALKLVNAPFADEPFGIGLKKGDDAFRTFLNNRLQTIFANGQWKSAYDATIGKLDLRAPVPPSLDRYPGTSTSSSTSSSSSSSSITTTSSTIAGQSASSS